VHVRHVVFGVSRGPRVGDRLAFLDEITASHERRAEMGERRFVTARRDDRDRRSVRRDLPGERDLPGSRRADDRRAFEGDVDPAVLSARVWVVADGVPAENGAVGGPGPGERVGSCHEYPADCRERDDSQSRCPMR
jgi:hypothetical protein